MQVAVRIRVEEMAPKAQGHTIYSYLMLYHCSRRLPASRKKVEILGEDQTAGKKKLSGVFEVEEHALLYIRSLVACKQDPRWENLFFSAGRGFGDSVLKEKGEARHDALDGRIAATGKTACEHTGWMDWMTKALQWPREEALFCNGETVGRRRRAM